MKILITSTAPNLDAEIDPRFGRCRYFIIVDPDTMEFESLENSSAMAGGGAGISAAQNITGKGVERTEMGSLRRTANDRIKALSHLVGCS